MAAVAPPQSQPTPLPAAPDGVRAVRVQTPLLEPVTCYCRGDAGLRTVAGASKFVPGAALCMQPDIKTNKRKLRGSKKDRSRTQHPLLPGLPDDLAIACLVRVPRVDHPNLRQVCKRWNRLLSGNYFYSMRKKCGLAEEWIYVLKRDRDKKISWTAFDPINHIWKPLPPVPSEYSEAVGFGCAVLSSCYLYLFGGKDPSRGSMRRVIYYNARTNKWHRAPDMLRKRHFFGSCVMNNCLYVAGGECEGINRSLRSAEVFDPNKNKWSFIGEMSSGMVPFIGVVYEGKWFLKGLDSHRHVISESYLPATNVWSVVNSGMVTGWRNPSIFFNGRLYSADCRDGCKLRVYDGATDTWIKFVDSKRHIGSSRNVEAASLVPLNGKLCIVRNNMSITLVNVADPVAVLETESARLWENVARRGQNRSFMANLWSTFAGRTVLKTHIVHCQVLQV